jgi:hypothetical protein
MMASVGVIPISEAEAINRPIQRPSVLTTAIPTRSNVLMWWFLIGPHLMTAKATRTSNGGRHGPIRIEAKLLSETPLLPFWRTWVYNELSEDEPNEDAFYTCF